MLLSFFVLAFVGLTSCNENTLQKLVSSDAESDYDSFYPPLLWSDVFDWKVLAALSEKSANVLFSPASLKIVLGLLYEASSGSTQKDFENSLQFLSKSLVRKSIKQTLDSLHVPPTSGNRLSVNTRVFLEANVTLKESYGKRIKEYFNTEVDSTNFTDTKNASEKINKWVSESTAGAITKLTEPDELKNMMLLVANTIYFKGIWKHQFPENATCIKGFYKTPETQIYVPFMTTTNSFYYHESDILESRLLRLPYKNSSLSMILILPFAKGGLPDLIKNLNLLNLHRELHFLDKKSVLVSIPKFSFKLKASLKDVLQELGLKKIFQNSASLTGLAEGNSTILRELVVSDILQTTGIEVDEEGSVAYATTEVIIGNKIGTPDNAFDATHPFLFLIQDDVSGTILFLGKVEDPMELVMEISRKPDNIEKEFDSYVASSTLKPK